MSTTKQNQKFTIRTHIHFFLGQYSQEEIITWAEEFYFNQRQ